MLREKKREKRKLSYSPALSTMEWKDALETLDISSLVSDESDEERVEETYSHKELVDSALVTVQSLSRLSVWVPPEDFGALVHDILIRFCGFKDTKEVLQKIDEEGIRKDHLPKLSVSSLQILGLSIGQALDFQIACGVVELQEQLYALSDAALMRIIDGSMEESKGSSRTFTESPKSESLRSGYGEAGSTKSESQTDPVIQIHYHYYVFSGKESIPGSLAFPPERSVSQLFHSGSSSFELRYKRPSGAPEKASSLVGSK